VYYPSDELREKLSMLHKEELWYLYGLRGTDFIVNGSFNNISVYQRGNRKCKQNCGK
jgi:hypothetical protein